MSLWNDLADPVFDGVGLAGFKRKAYVFFFSLSCSIHTIVFTVFPFLFFLSIGWYCGAGARPSAASGLGVCEWSPQGLYDKTVSWIPNTDEILKFLNKKII